MRNAEVIRQWKLLREIESRRNGATIHELSRMVKVSTRTIRRDLLALQSAGFSLYDEGEENETKRWKLNLQPFKQMQEGLSVADVAALFLSRAVVEAMSGWPLAEELKAAFAKLERGLNPRMVEFLSTLPQVISTKRAPRARRDSPSMIGVTQRLFDAARGLRIAEMRYFSASSNRAKVYVIHPYRLALADGGLYLIAWVPQYNNFRTFAVDRIERLSVTEETFRKTRELPADVFGTSMGVFSGTPEKIELEFDAKLAVHVRGRLWHDSQHIDELPDGGLRMTLLVSDDWALRRWLLGFGAGVRVVRPASLSSAIASELGRAAAQYQ